MKLITCKKCGANNRIHDYSFRRIPLCGRCKNALKEPLLIRLIRYINEYKYWGILSVIILGTAWLTIRGDTPQSSKQPTQSPSVASVSNTTPNSPNHPQLSISQGVQWRLNQTAAIAPLEIITSPGPQNYYVKLVDALSDEKIMLLFIRGGQRLETKVPLGRYKIKYAVGETWYGEKYLFGPETRYSEAEKLFDFERQGNQISGYTVELIFQPLGNLHVNSISANEF